METLIDLLNSEGLMPHGYCLRWNSPLLWLHVVSDVLIAFAYYSIPLSLIYFVWQRKDLPYPRLFLLFGAFILACGTTHLMSVIVIWKPLYWLDGVVKVFTALVSVAAALLVFWIIPKALQLTSAEQLRAEIEQRRQAEESLRQSESKFRTLFDSSSDALVLFDHQGFWDCNAAGLAMFGCPDKSLFLNKHPVDFSPEKQACGTDSIVLAQKHIDRVMAIGSHRFEWLHKRIDTDEVFPAEVLLMMMTIDDKSVIYGVIRDISERKRAEECLKRSEAQFRTLIETLPVGVTLHNTQTKTLLHNACALKLLGLSSEELLNRTSFDDNWSIFDEQGQLFPNYKLPVPQVIATRQTVRNMTMEVLRPSQQDSVWLLVTATPQLNSDGSVLQVICSFIDITELKKTEQRLSESEARLNLSQEYGGIGCWESDLIHNRQVWSKTTYELMGSPAILEPTHEDFLAFVHPDDKQNVINAYQDHLMRGAEYDVEYRVILNDGQQRWLRSIGKAEFDENDRPIRFIGIVQDISESKAMEAE
ncbi:partial putative diguanylate cyclase DgcE, partial [Patescibacteria group bacterium]